MILGEKIIALRKRMNWSQEELAEKLNISRQSVWAFPPPEPPHPIYVNKLDNHSDNVSKTVRYPAP